MGQCRKGCKRAPFFYGWAERRRVRRRAADTGQGFSGAAPPMPADISIEPQTWWLDIHPTTRKPNKTIDPPLNNKKGAHLQRASPNTMKNTILFDSFSDVRERMSYRRSNIIDLRFIIAPADKKCVDPASNSELKNSSKKCDFMPLWTRRF